MTVSVYVAFAPLRTIWCNPQSAKRRWRRTTRGTGSAGVVVDKLDDTTWTHVRRMHMPLVGVWPRGGTWTLPLSGM